MNTVYRLLYAALLPLGAIVISWDPNTEPDLKGYKIYYGTSPGGYTQIIDVGKKSKYIIRNLQEGIPYYFAVTAYDTAGNESGFSNEVSIVFAPGTGGDSNPVSTAYNYPNPFDPGKEVTHIRYYLNTPTVVSIVIYDLGNNRVRTLVDREVRLEGEHTEDVWDGLDENGERVANGLYFCRITTERWSQFIKIAVAGN